MTQIIASGISTSYFSAERATIIARVSVRSRNRDRSVSQASALHNALVARATQLRERGDATWHAAEPISTWASVAYPDGADKPSVVQHYTNSRVRVKLSNLEIVATLIDEFARAGAEPDVEWSLTEETKRQREREARIAAVGEARKIAEDYASALNERVTRVVSISDRQHDDMYDRPLMLRASSIDAVSAPAEVTLPEITVSATIEGVFESA